MQYVNRFSQMWHAPLDSKSSFVSKAEPKLLEFFKPQNSFYYILVCKSTIQYTAQQKTLLLQIFLGLMFLRDTNLAVASFTIFLSNLLYSTWKIRNVIISTTQNVVQQTLVVLELFTIVADVYILQLSNLPLLQQNPS